MQEEHKDLLAKIGTLQRGAEETKKQIENVQRADGQSGKAEEVLYKMQEEHKELFTNINKRIEDLYDKTRRFNEWLVNSQKQLEESGKVLTKMQGSLTDISKMPKDTKAPELDKFAKNLEENSKYVHKVNADIEHMHNKMIEHEDQINDLKRIFEDMDATFAEMNKRFQKIETVERGN
jgi:chromosome segregation ATPase